MQNGLTIAQLDELKRYAKERGRFWKSDLRVEWETGTNYSAELQQIRNNFGPSWLMKFRFAKSTIEKEGLN